MIEQLHRDLAAALEPILERAFAHGLLVGGVLNIVQDGRRVRTLTIRRGDDAQQPAPVPQDPDPTPLRDTIVAEACCKCGGTRMQRTGVCKTCLDCGESGGCG